MLTGKAKEDFNKYLGEPFHFINFDNIPDFVKFSYLMHWFDHVGIFIIVKRFVMSLEFKEWYFIITDKRGMHLNNHVSKESRIENDSRTEIMINAIKKANEIYNSRL